MDEQKTIESTPEENTLELYSQRITKVEAQVEIVSIRQTQMQSVITDMKDLLKEISKQITTTELGVVAIRERTDQHTKTIEHLQEGESDVSKILANMNAQMNILKSIGAVLLSLVIAYFFSRFLP